MSKMKIKETVSTILLALAASIILSATAEATDTAKWKTAGLRQANSMGGGDGCSSRWQINDEFANQEAFRSCKIRCWHAATTCRL